LYSGYLILGTGYWITQAEACYSSFEHQIFVGFSRRTLGFGKK